MSAKSMYIIAALLLVATIPMYIKIYTSSKTARAIALQPSLRRELDSPSSSTSRAYGWTDVHRLGAKGFHPAKPLPPGYECSSANGYVVQVKVFQGQKMIEPLMDNGQMLRCFNGLYGGNVR